MLAAVVVTYSADADLLDRCLSALLATDGLDQIIVVDTGGTAATPADDRVDLVRTENRGYGAAANVGFARADGFGADAYVLLNDDVFVQPGWLPALTAALDGPASEAIGAVQPKLMYADRQPPTINSLGVTVGRDGAGLDVGVGEPDHDEPTSAIDAFTGGAVLLTRRFIESTGGFDERYFLYYEDVDLAARGRRLGWRYLCVPESVVDHVGSLTTGGDSRRTYFLQERNRLWCAFRNLNTHTVCGAVWLSVRRLRHPPRRVHAHALAAGLAGAPRRLAERVSGRHA